MDGGYSVQLDHLMLMLTYNRDYFSNVLFHFIFFSNKKLEIATSFAQVKKGPNSSLKPFA